MSNFKLSKAAIFTEAMPSPNQLVDLDSVLERLDGDVDLFQDFIEIFMEDAPALVEEIGTAVKEVDATALKGLLLNFGAKECVDLALALEKAGRANEMGNVKEDHEKLLVSYDALRDELRTLRSNKQIPQERT